MEKDEVLKYLTLSTNRQVYYLKIDTIHIIHLDPEAEPMIAAEFVDKSDDTGTIYFTPKFKIKSVQYDLPF